ncbi:hypothetical protein ACRRTK_007434 [Alexandromys fortis]
MWYMDTHSGKTLMHKIKINLLLKSIFEVCSQGHLLYRMGPTLWVYLIILLFSFLSQDKVSLCYSPDCPRTPFVDQAGLKLTELKCWDCHFPTAKNFPLLLL